MKMMRVAAVVGLVWGGVLAGLSQGEAKADSSASLRNDKQIAGNDDLKTGNDQHVGNGKRPMTFADLMAMKRVSDPQISASGKWVMFSVTDVSLEKNTKVNHLWIVGLEGRTNAGPSTAASAKNAPASVQDDNIKGRSGGERQVTFGEGESNGRFSPDGKWISISMKDQIYLAPWDEAAGTVGAAVPLTRVSGADGGIWSPDSKRLMFVANVYPECSNKATWAEEDACDKARDEAADKSPVKAQLWDALLYRHWDHYLGVKRSHVLVVAATDGGMVRDLTPANVVGDAETPTFSLGGPLGYAWAPDSEEIAYVTNLDKVPAASTNNDVFTLRLDETGAKAAKVSTSPGSDDGPAYSPDGKWLAFRSQARNGFESDKFELAVRDRHTGQIIRPLTATGGNRELTFDGWVDEFSWLSDSSNLSFTTGIHGEEPFGIVSTVEHTPGYYEHRINSDVSGELSDVHVLSDFSILAIRMLVNSPAEIVHYSAPHFSLESGKKESEGDLTRLTHSNDALLSQLSLTPLEAFWFTGAEGTKVEGFLIKPPGFDPAKKYPVKFLMHGGPQTAWGDAWSFRWNWELMAANGYVVVGINRRGSTGYGQKFVDEVSGDWGGRAYVDLMKGLDYAEGHFPFIDKTRECALGASYGGFMADWVLTHTDRFKCIVTHDGLYDPASAYGDTEEMWFNEWEFRRAQDFPKGWDGFPPQQAKIAGGSGFTDPTHAQTARVNGAPTVEGRAAMPWRYAALPADQDPFRKWSPMLHIQDAKTPTLVIHSQKDYRLDVSQGIALFTALQRLGVPSKMLYFPDEGHWVLKPQNSQMWNEVVGDWCDRWTKTGKYAETGR